MTVLKIILVEELSSEAVKELLAVGSPHNPHVGYIICCTFLWIRSDYWLDSQVRGAGRKHNPPGLSKSVSVTGGIGGEVLCLTSGLSAPYLAFALLMSSQRNHKECHHKVIAVQRGKLTESFVKSRTRAQKLGQELTFCLNKQGGSWGRNFLF